jgi:hypothetical protein
MTPEEERAVCHFPSGYRYSLLFVAYCKHALVNHEMRAGHRLQFLEWINKQVDIVITADMLAAVEPMSVTEVKMMDEALSLDREGDPAGMASFRVLTSPDVFADFLRLNPSLLKTIMLHDTLWTNSAHSSASPSYGARMEAHVQ